jgi:uncharacterized protein (TIGR02266 family)
MDERMKNSEAQKERRAAPRIPIEIWVEESTDRELYFQRGANLSSGGIFLERTIPHAKGTMVQLRFTLPDEAVPIQVKGEIVNVSPEPSELGMGIKFLNLCDADQHRIEAFIDRAQKKR